MLWHCTPGSTGQKRRRIGTAVAPAATAVLQDLSRAARVKDRAVSSVLPSHLSRNSIALVSLTAIIQSVAIPNLPQVDVASKSKSSSAVIKIQNDAELEKHQHKHVIRVTSNPQQDPDSQARFRPTTLYSSSLHQNRHQQNLNLQQQPKKPICTSTTSLNTNQSPPNNEPMYATIGSNQKRLLSSLKSANV